MGREEIPLTVEDRGSGESLLMSPLRRRLFLAVATRPCLHVRQLARDVGASPQSVSWHLRRLVESGYLGSTPWRGKSAHYPDAFVAPEDVPILAALRRDLSGQVFVAIRGSPGIRQVDVVESAGTYQQAVLPHLKDLETLGLITRRRARRATTYAPTDLLTELREAYIPREKPYAAWLRSTLEADHLLPRSSSRRGSVLKVTVRPERKDVVLRFPLNPMDTV